MGIPSGVRQTLESDAMHIDSPVLDRYDKARQIKESQDEYCAKANRGNWNGLGAYPEDLQWEALVDVLRGRVKVQYPSHTYLASYKLTEGHGRSIPTATRPSTWMTWSGCVFDVASEREAIGVSETQLRVADYERVQVPNRGVPPCA